MMHQFSDEQDTKLTELLNCLHDYVAQMSCMREHYADLKAAGVRLTGIEITLSADPIRPEAAPVAPGATSNDLAWLKSLRIAPDLEVR